MSLLPLAYTEIGFDEFPVDDVVIEVFIPVFNIFYPQFANHLTQKASTHEPSLMFFTCFFPSFSLHYHALQALDWLVQNRE